MTQFITILIYLQPIFNFNSSQMQRTANKLIILQPHPKSLQNMINRVDRKRTFLRSENRMEIYECKLNKKKYDLGNE